MFSVIRSSIVSSKTTPVSLACLVLTGSLAGCSTIENMLGSEKVDYRSAAKQTGGLDVPPDLTQLNRETRPQGGVVSAAALQQQQQSSTTPRATAGSTATAVALNAVGDLRIERNGAERWLHSSLTPEQLWPQVRAFWTENGFELNKEQADVGVMETNWNENRAKLPQDIIRTTIGRVFDGLYSTGERDMFRTRVERAPAGGTEIYVSHRGMQEVYTNQQRDNTAWQPRPNDPQLEAEMLSRLMLKLGGKAEEAKAVAAGTPPATTTIPKAPVEPRGRPLADVPDSLQVNEGFERAWRRVGQSLDRHGFTIEDRDRTQGLFFLRYADPNQAGKEEPNWFSRTWDKMFGKDGGTPASARYRVSVKSEGERSTVMVLDDRGQQQTGEIAKRILNLLMDDLR